MYVLSQEEKSLQYALKRSNHYYYIHVLLQEEKSLQYALMRSNLDAISTPPVSQILPQGLTLSTTPLQVRRESQRVAPGLLWAAAGQRSPAEEA